jgi:hypothetical protein
MIKTHSRAKNNERDTPSGSVRYGIYCLQLFHVLAYQPIHWCDTARLGRRTFARLHDVFWSREEEAGWIEGVHERLMHATQWHAVQLEPDVKRGTSICAEVPVETETDVATVHLVDATFVPRAIARTLMPHKDEVSYKNRGSSLCQAFNLEAKYGSYGDALRNNLRSVNSLVSRMIRLKLDSFH